MKEIEFIKKTISELSPEEFIIVRNILVNKYISFSFLKSEEVTKSILCEKMCDYFKSYHIISGKDFNKTIETYMSTVLSLIDDYIEKDSKAKKKGQSSLELSRTRKYFNKIERIKNTNKKDISMIDIQDFTRISFCLYTSIKKQKDKDKDKVIREFNYSVKLIDINKIVSSMESEEITGVLPKTKSKSRFDTSNLYNKDTCFFILTIILLGKVINDCIEGDYYHE